MSPSLELIKQQVSQLLVKDRSSLTKFIAVIEKRQKQNLAVEKLLVKAQRQFQKSHDIVKNRKLLIPQNIKFDSQLPVSQAKKELVQKIAQNQVIIVAGETGSGKTTQLPKICLELGLGVYGRIGHTQPRRVAATSVARRIAEELESPLGKLVGYSIRFNDQSDETTPVRVMTDGILLNEITKDPMLLDYDTIIIDEAHERSLNIDFLLGYLKTLIKKRSDLKIIITSATIDLERFSKHFNDAPIIEVSGRTYPVDVWYREPDEENPIPQVEQIGYAVDELVNFDSGDILIFLSGEAEIRETAKFLRKERFNETEVLPLYARLSINEQEKIFKTSKGKRRIVLATNVAETSITVPGIRFVIDPGFARISRYSVRNKIQRLPIEKISQASANQRKGRCGRVADGVCIRLYSEEDFELRSEFTDAEILRTNLAAVILQMKQFATSDKSFDTIESFPFIDPPVTKQINDGLNLLAELEALDGDRNLTQVGRKMASLPIEPRLSRILIAGEKQACLQETLVIAAFLSVKDPREWPFEKRELAQQKHKKYSHSQSDFISVLNLWEHLHEQNELLSNNGFKKYCIEELVNPNSYREWKSTYRQLKSLMNNISKNNHHSKNTTSERTLAKKLSFNLKTGSDPESDKDKKLIAQNYKVLHSTLLSGLLSYIGQKDIEKGYVSARQSKYFIHPQSVNFKKQPAWVMAFEVVETTQAYARLSAYIESIWVEDAAKHLLKTHYYDPHWSKNRGCVIANMQQTLFGLKIVNDRKVDYSNIEPEQCRELFIRHALVRQEMNPFGRHQDKNNFFLVNQQTFVEVETEIAKARQADLRSNEADIIAWFDKQLPAHVCNSKTLNKWLLQDKEKHNQQLILSKETLFEKPEQEKGLYPETIEVKDVILALSYHFEPGHPQDGVTVKIPKSLRQRFSDSDFERLVPGILEEKIEFMLRSLPKRIRKNFVPIPQFAKACYQLVLADRSSQLIDILNKHLYKMTGVIITSDMWQELKLPDHYLMRFEVIDDKEKVVFSARTLKQQKENSKVSKAVNTDKAKASIKDKQSYVDWSFDFIKTSSIEEAGTTIPIYYAIEDAGNKVRMVHLVSQSQANQVHLRGCCRLVAIACQDKIKYIQKSYSQKAKLSLAISSFTQSLSNYNDVIEDVVLSVIKPQLQKQLPFTKNDFLSLVESITKELIAKTTEALDSLTKVLATRAELLSSINKQNKQYKALREDIDEQMQLLFCDGFVYRYGIDKINDYKRYMLALGKRVVKAKENLLKEAQAAQLLNPWLDWYYELKEKQRDNPNSFSLAELDEYLWMLEEYRISIFAQGQKTRFPISDKRLQKFVDHLQSKC